MLNKAKINAIHELLEKDIITTEEYMLILNALGSKEVKSDEIGDDNRISIDIIVDAVQFMTRNQVLARGLQDYIMVMNPFLMIG